MHFDGAGFNGDVRNQAKAWMLRNQLGRRNISLYDRSLLALKLKPLIQAGAKERMITAPQKKAEQEREIQKIWEEHPYDVARNLVANKKQQIEREERTQEMRDKKYIYFARFENDGLKVGSSVYPEIRIKQLSVSCPGIQLTEKIFFGEGAEKHESALKKKFSTYLIGNECYKCPDEILEQMIAYTRKESTRKDSTDYQLAKIAGTSHDTIRKVEEIEAKASDTVKQRIRNGDQSINGTWLEIKERERKQEDLSARAHLEKAEERHADFQSAKTVTFNDVVQDKEDSAEIANSKANEIYNAIKRILFIGAQVSGGDNSFSIINKKTMDENRISRLKGELDNAISVLTMIRDSIGEKN